ncbi:MAG: GspE/PulE family protein [Eubacteriaceae bacterium]
MKDNNLILEILLKRDVITQKDISFVSGKLKGSQDSIIDKLILSDRLKEEQLVKSLCEEMGFEIYDYEKTPIDLKGVFFIKKFLAQSLKIFPVRENKDKSILVIMSDPTDENSIRRLEEITKKRIVIQVATESRILSYIERYYIEEPLMGDEKKISLLREDVPEKNMSIIELADKILEDGICYGASDIHIEGYSHWVQIRFRIDGLLKKYREIEVKVWESLITRLKILGGCDIGEERLPQDGAFVKEFQGRQIDFRLSLIPTIHGEKIVLRILDQSRFLKETKKLGLSKEQYGLLKEIMDSPNGLVLISGATGSGKSTTLYSLLNEINMETQNVITIEDPVELQIDGISQIQVNEKIGLSFSTGLRSILRQDPNVIVVGEMRDEETASIGIRAGITGHLVLATIHTNNAISSITRLLDMNVPRYLLADCIRGIISQKLVRRLCPDCKKKRGISEEERSYFNLREGTEVFDSVGCSNCSGSGYKGRIAVLEVLKITKNLRTGIGVGERNERLKEMAMADGFYSMEESVKRQILKGVISMEEGISALAIEKLCE